MFSSHPITSYNPSFQLFNERLNTLSNSTKKLKQINVKSSKAFGTLAEQGVTGFSDIKVLNAVGQSSQDYGRTGIRTLCKKAQVVFSCEYQGKKYQTQTPTNPTLIPVWKPYYEQVRCMIIWDTQPNGSVPTIQDILGSISSTGAVNSFTSANDVNLTTPPITAFINVDNKRRFTILRDKFLTLGDPTPSLSTDGVNPTVTTGSGSSTSVYTRKFSLNDLQTELNRKTVVDSKTTFENDPQILDPTERLAISTGQLISVIYCLKPNIVVTTTSTVWYEDS